MAGRRIKKRTWIPIAVVSVLVILVTCSERPPGPSSNPPAFALKQRPDTRLGAVEAGVRERFGDDATGLLALGAGRDALDWWLTLFDLAEDSLDAQYFKWYDDAAGLLLLERLLDAADRGVQVRLLIDDLGLKGSDHKIASLCLHPNIDVRVFNPWGSRNSKGARSLEWLLNHEQLNRRMHNKLLVADGTAAITGGRNIADRFFGLGEDFNVIDLDLLVAGPLAREISAAFDAYWNGEMVHLGAGLDPGVSSSDLLELRAELKRKLDDHSRVLAGFPRERGEWSDRVPGVADEMTSGPARVVWDPPGDDGTSSPERVIDSVMEFADGLDRELIISSAFLVPDDEDVEWFRALTARGVRVRILTNSLASNIGTIANSGYKKYRKKLLAAGVELHELRVDAEVRPAWRIPPTAAEQLALHAKAMVVDRRRVFVGSLNLDPRSVDLNTEMGVLSESPELARQVAVFLEQLMEPENAWRVRLDDVGDLVWQCSDRSVTRQPARGKTQRIKDWLYGLLPIQHHL